MHWVLDVDFREDENPSRSSHIATNTTIARHIVLNVLKQDTSVKLGIAGKRLEARWDMDDLLKKLYRRDALVLPLRSKY